MKKGNPLAFLDEGLLAHENQRQRNNNKHKFSDMVFFMYFLQVSKSQAATKEHANSLTAQEFRIQRLLMTLK